MWLGLKIISIKIQAFWFFSSDQVVTWEWLDHFFEFWPFWAYYSLLLHLILWKGSHTAPDILVNLKNFANSQPSASNFKRFSQSLEQFFLTVGQSNFGNKIPFSNCANKYLLFFAVPAGHRAGITDPENGSPRRSVVASRRSQESRWPLWWRPQGCVKRILR